MKQKLKELRDDLQRWKSHNEVNARPADEMLYKFLDGIMKLAEGVNDDIEETKETESKAENVEINPEVVNEPESLVAPAGDEDGSNPPNGPGTPP